VFLVSQKRMPEKQELVLTRLVLDVLKPHKPDVVEFAQALSVLRGVTRVDVSIVEVDADTETVKLVVEGNGLAYEGVLNAVKQLGAAVHSVDQVVYSSPSQTPRTRQE